MSQNLAHLQFDLGYLESQIDPALLALETFSLNLVTLSPEDRKRLMKMGDKSEAFCRLSVDVFRQNREIMPRGFDLDDYKTDLEQLDMLRQRIVRLSKIQQIWSDTEMALGSDLMVNSLEGYAYLKVAGKSMGLDAVRNHLSARFHRKPRTPVEPPMGQ